MSSFSKLGKAAQVGLAETEVLAAKTSSAKSNGNDAERPKSSVSLSVQDGDSSILTAVIDRTATQSKIMEDLKQELSKFGAPYRSVDARIFEAVQLHEREGISYPEASTRIFGNPAMAEKIRYWHNNWSRQ